MKTKRKPKRRERLCDNCVALLYLLSDIRAAVGDPYGKLMQNELLERCRKLAKASK
jgi:hypothetical protein